jgi:hypothetical protein
MNTHSVNESQSKLVLRAGLQRYMEDCSIEVPYRIIDIYARSDAQAISSALQEWSFSKQIKIVKATAECAPDDICIVLLRYLDAAPPFQGFVAGVRRQVERCLYLTPEERHLSYADA